MTTLATPPKLQFFDANGNPLSGGKLYTYAAGTTTPLATYTDYGGGTPNANPVVLDSRGEASVWLGPARYKVKLTTSTGTEIWTVDDVGGADGATLAALAASGGSALIGFLQAGSGAVARTVQSKERDMISVLDFGAVGDGSTDDTAALQAAFTAGAAARKTVYVPGTTNYYKITNTLSVPDYCSISGDGYGSCIKQTVREKNVLDINDYCVVRYLRLQGDGVTSGGVDFTKNNGATFIGSVQSSIIGCYIHGCEFNGIYAADYNNIVIAENWIYGNAYSIGSGSDIVIYSSSTGSRCVIRNNFCLSNNSQGIYTNALGKDTEVMVQGNICATLDASGVPVSSGSLARRHGIVLGYVGGASGGRSICNGNMAFNTRQTGIYWQGATAPTGMVIITSNYIRSVGINAVEPGLAAGIFVAAQGKGDIIANNVIDGMAQTGFATAAGISVLPSNSGVDNDNSTTIDDNTIFNSSGHGVYIGSNAQNVSVINNTIRKTTQSYLLYTPDASFTGGGRMVFSGNRCSGMTQATYGFYISPQSATGIILQVNDNDIYGYDNSTASTTNAGIFLRNFSISADFRGNVISNFYGGVSADVYVNVRANVRFSGNTYASCNAAYHLGYSTGGLLVTCEDRLISTSTYQSAALLSGTRVCWQGIYGPGSAMLASGSAAPTVSTWAVGDRVQQSAMAAGSPKAWACTVAGTPGTWVSEGNL